MRSVRLGLALLAAAFLSVPGATQRTPEPPGLSAFRSDAELRAFLRRLAAEQVVADEEAPPPPPPPAPPPPPPPPAAAAPAPAARAPAAESITNTQVAGVDEGGIVKTAGDYLVVLRRGRLFTVYLANGGLRPVAAIDAYPPGVDGSGDWYDEMLVAGDRVVVIGYSYARGGTEVNRFRLGRDGSLRFEDSTQLKSNDYYSSRNYASRLIGNRLIYYTPLYLNLAGDPLQSLPAIRRWSPGARGSEKGGGAWRRVVGAQRVFVPERLRQAANANLSTVHSVTSCDLAAPVLDCQATAVLGAPSRTFFVSGNAIYVWTADLWNDERRAGPNGLLYRIPLAGTARPQAVGVRGGPVDQFSFGPDPARAALNVVVRRENGGDAMWRPELPAGALALLRIPMARFGSGAQEVPLDRYQPLPAVQGWSVQNRFVGDHLLYGAERTPRVTVVGVGDARVTELPLPHDVSRLDLMGADAIVVGDGRGGLNFSTVTLGARPARSDTFLLPAAREGESRSHAFFFRPDTPDGRTGLLGLPVGRSVTEGTRFLGASAAIQFLRRRDARLADAGELAARGVAGQPADDGCRASCVDWYGNARPIFWRGRVFALMGYEIVEGREESARVREVRRVSFSPRLVR